MRLERGDSTLVLTDEHRLHYKQIVVKRDYGIDQRDEHEHTSDEVLKVMRKPSFQQFVQFKRIFDRVNAKYHLNQQLIPYFISSHPACHEMDMAELAALTKELNFHLEQVQDFTPTPMTVATEAFYTGLHPYTLQPIYTAHTKDEKLAQRKYFFWYDKKYKADIIRSLKKMHRNDLINKLYPKR